MKTIQFTAAMALALASLGSQAAVSAADAAKLKSELTPVGAEKAGNKEGTIPAWAGGYSTPIPGDVPGGHRSDPFKDDKPLFTITGKNVDQYASKLSDGQVQMLKKHPDYQIDVYTTRRTAIHPQWLYDNTFKNATRAVLKDGVVEGAFGGIPFPIPQTGEEVMWNHTLRWQGQSWQFIATQYLIKADGNPVLTTDGIGDISMPYYFADSSLEQFNKNGNEFWLLRLVNAGPPIRAGEAVTSRFNLDSNKDLTWLYLTGQRRSRKLPNPCCDTPTPATAGVMMMDELSVWQGRLDRFDWKIIGKQEMYIPYNNNKILQPKTDAEVLSKFGIKPSLVRWELHRVWVVEANLRQGQRHQVKRSRYYCDEDTWRCALADRWDSKGELWKSIWLHNIVAPDLPGLIDGAFGYNDHLSGAGYVTNLFNTKSAQMPMRPRQPDSLFTPDAMSGESVR